jgi:hypothetical protein
VIGHININDEHGAVSYDIKNYMYEETDCYITNLLMKPPENQKQYTPMWCWETEQLRIWK